MHTSPIVSSPVSRPPAGAPSSLGFGQRWTALRPLAATLVGLAALAASPGAALADLKLCNMTASRVGVSIGYRDAGGWVAEGWWNVMSHSCETILVGALKSRFYYVHAVDYDQGGEWSGTAFMCTAKEAFTIRGVEGCDRRGYARTGFFEIDTREEPDWTIRLTDPDSGSQSGTDQVSTQ
ncbi:MAG: DUF1036 domain-containing protein [Rhizobiales bacterium]|nr:DUF1036 domain-containing protein [Hyphomicrobiales bacterium]